MNAHEGEQVAAASPVMSVQKPTTPRRRSWRMFMLLLACGGLLATGFFVFGPGSRKAESKTRGTEPRKSAAISVEVVHPRPGGLERTSAMSGSVHPYEQADLYANVSGYLKSQQIMVNGKPVMVDLGVHVKKGEVLAVIDVPEVFAAVEQAKADVAQAQAQMAQEKAHIETAEADQKAAEAEIVQSQAEVGRYTAGKLAAQKSYQRYRGLRTENAVEQDVVDQREDTYESAVAAEQSAMAGVLTAKAKLVAAKAKVDQARADFRAAEASVDVARAKLKKAGIFVEYTQIHSPYDGVITHREYFVGDYIRSAAEGNSRPMYTVARTDIMRIRTKLSDRDVPYADIGDPAVITIDALPGLELEGKVARFSEAEIPNERTMITEIDLANTAESPSQGKLREGMYGLATIRLNPPSGNVSVPSNCVTEYAEVGHAKVLVERDGHARAVSVKTGADDGIRVEVLSGLSPEDEVIVPNGAVADGTAIAPIRSSASTKTAPPAHESES